MLERRIDVGEKTGDVIDLAAWWAVIDAAADGEIDGALVLDQCPQLCQMVGRPHVVMANIADPFAARASNAFVVGKALASAGMV